MQFKGLLLLAIICVSYTYCEISYNVDTRQVTTGVTGASDEEFAENLKAQVLAAPQPQGYCTVDNPTFPLSNGSTCGSNQNIGWIFTFNFSDNEDATYSIQFGTDFGRGAAVYVDDVFQFARTDDLWWAGNWASGDVFDLQYDFPAGEHTVVVYGSEACCDGAMNVRFNRNGGDYQAFSVENLNATVPEYVPEDHEVEEFTGVEINIGTRYGASPVGGADAEFAQNLVNQYEGADQPDGYCDTTNPTFPLSNASTCGSNQNILWRFEFKFYNVETSDWALEFGTDFGRGTAVFIDDEFSFARTEDLWWAGNWNSGAVIKINESWGPGAHTVVVYGSEKCCDGAMDVRFSYNGGDWQSLSVENVQSTLDAVVPSDCVVLYSECDYSGDQLVVCDKNGDISDFPIRSISIPEGIKAIIYNQKMWEGQKAQFEESVDCIEKINFSDPAFLLQHKITLLKSKKQTKNHAKHLRHQKAHKK